MKRLTKTLMVCAFIACIPSVRAAGAIKSGMRKASIAWLNKGIRRIDLEINRLENKKAFKMAKFNNKITRLETQKVKLSNKINRKTKELGRRRKSLIRKRQIVERELRNKIKLMKK